MAIRNNDGFQSGARLSSASRANSEWLQVPELSSIQDSRSSGRKQVFAVVFPPEGRNVDGKKIQRILIFDNHPDSLRFLTESGRALYDDEPAVPNEKRRAFVCGLALIVILGLAVLWPLL